MTGGPFLALRLAFCHPLRCSILGCMCFCDSISTRRLSTELNHPIAVVSYHMRVLMGLGFVDLGDTRTVGGSIEYFYCLAVGPADSGEQESRSPA